MGPDDELALSVMALAFLVAYAWPILDPNLSRAGRGLAEAITAITWAAFAIDYVARVVLAERRWHDVARHPFELATVALPLLRPLRLLRLITLLSVLHRHASSSLRGELAVYAAGSAAMLSGVRRSRSWTPSARPPMPTSPASGMRCGGH